MRRTYLAVPLMVAALVLTACQGLSSALGLQPTALAPVNNGGVAIIALPGSWQDVNQSPDSSGAVGATGSANQEQGATQDIKVDPAEVAKAITEIAPMVTPGGLAATALTKAQAALLNGDATRAAKLAAITKGLAEAEKAAADAAKEAADAEKEPDPAPAPADSN